MSKDLPFNLIITHLPGYGMRRETLLELHNYLDYFKLVFYDKNKLLGKVKEPKVASLKLCKELPEKTTILRAIPIDDVVPPKISYVIESVKKLLEKRNRGKFAVKVDGYLMNKNGNLIHRPEAASIIGANIDRDVNLKKPDILVYIKVTKFRRMYVAAIFVDDPKYIFSSAKRLCSS